MIDLAAAATILTLGKELPQRKLPSTSPETAERLQELVPQLLNMVFETAGAGKEPLDSLMPRLAELADEYGWYATAGVLSSQFAHWYQADVVPNMSGVADPILRMLRWFPVFAEQERAGDHKAWVLPMIVLAEAGEKEALEFTACAALCASVGYVRSSLEKRAEGEGS